MIQESSMSEIQNTKFKKSERQYKFCIINFSVLINIVHFSKFQ